jgi:hypothetical protein
MRRIRLALALLVACAAFGCAANRARTRGMSMSLDASCLTRPLLFTGCDSAEPPNCTHLEPVRYKRGCGVMGIEKSDPKK